MHEIKVAWCRATKEVHFAVQDGIHILWALCLSGSDVVSGFCNISTTDSKTGQERIVFQILSHFFFLLWLVWHQ